MTLKQLFKKTGLKEYRVSFGMFDFQFNCIVGKYEEVPKYLAYKFEATEEEMERWNEELDGKYKPLGRWFCKNEYCPIIWIPRKPKTPREIATLAHEILHVVYELCRWAGLPLNESTEEVRTHAQAHALTKLLSEIK